MSRRWLTPERRDTPELMDAPGLPEAEVVAAYQSLRRVNRQLGNLGSMRREIARMLNEDGPWNMHAGISVLDVGTGSGDIPLAIENQLATRQVQGALVLALDRDPTASRLAQGAGARVVRGDALRLPFPDASIDLVTAAKFAHHFQGASLLRLVSEMARVARRRVLILDIRRHWLAYYGFIAWSGVFARNRLVRHDGPLSVLRGFTAEELIVTASSVAGFAWTVRAYPGFQLALVGRRSGADGRVPSE